MVKDLEWGEVKHVIEVLGSASCCVYHAVHQALVNNFTVTLEGNKSTTFLVCCRHLKHCEHCDEETLIDLH